VGPFTPLIIGLALLLIIPATILPGYRRPHGSIVLSSGATLVLYAIFWLLGGPGMIYANGDPVRGIISPLLLLGGSLLLLASWALSLNAAAQSRHWPWVALLTCSGLLTFGVVLLVFLPIPYQALCLFGQISFGPDGPVCEPVNPLVPLLITVGFFVGPAAALLSAVRPSLLSRRTLRLGPTSQLPEGLTVSRLGATDEPTIEPDPFS
jgi:hypothetical protein